MRTVHRGVDIEEIDLRDGFAGRRRRGAPLHARPLPPEHPTVLVVDDEQDVREWLRVSLGLAGWEVLDAADASTALARCESTEPDVVILDQRLPGVSGIDCAAALRARKVGSVLLLFSAAVDPRAVETARSLGVVQISKIERSLLFQIMDRLRDDAYQRRQELRAELSRRP